MQVRRGADHDRVQIFASQKFLAGCEGARHIEIGGDFLRQFLIVMLNRNQIGLRMVL